MTEAGGHLLQVKGSAVYSRLQWVREKKGEDGLQALAELLSPAGRNLVRHPVDRKAWYNFPLFMELSTAIDRKFGAGDGLLNIELGRYGCHLNTPTLYSWFIRLGSVDWVLRQASKFWGEHFNAGQLVVRHEPGADRAEGEIVDFPQPHIAHCYAVLGFAIACIELSGETTVRGRLIACRARGAPQCLMRVYWGTSE